MNIRTPGQKYSSLQSVQGVGSFGHTCSTQYIVQYISFSIEHKLMFIAYTMNILYINVVNQQ